ncbi:MAG: hypothetical protein AABY07_02580 [Nanoarchaeota archaeon]
MVEEINNIISYSISKIASFFNSIIPDEYKGYLNLGLLIILLTIYSIFIWKFYRFIGRRDLLELNLSQYNRSEHPSISKFFAILFFILEYIIILPIVVFFWFIVMTLILLILAEKQSIETILLVSTLSVVIIRITSYYEEDLSKEIAKLFPFTMLLVSLLTPEFLNINDILSKASNIPSLIPNVIFYLLVIIFLEFTLRMFYLITSYREEEKNPFS